MCCKKCEHLLKDGILFCCGLEHTENSDVDVTMTDKNGEWIPFDFQPDWCVLKMQEENA